MLLSRLETIYNWVNNLGPNVKTVLIIILSVLVIEISYNNHSKLILQDYTE